MHKLSDRLSRAPGVDSVTGPPRRPNFRQGKLSRTMRVAAAPSSGRSGPGVSSPQSCSFLRQVRSRRKTCAFLAQSSIDIPAARRGRWRRRGHRGSIPRCGNDVAPTLISGASATATPRLYFPFPLPCAKSFGLLWIAAPDVHRRPPRFPRELPERCPEYAAPTRKPDPPTATFRLRFRQGAHERAEDCP
jgi:hypothetical protein